MSDIVIRAEGLGKKYVIGDQAERERYTALRDTIPRNMKRLARSAADLVRGPSMRAANKVENFWALKSLNFDIERGEVVGIIGRNGAGKSTLLKILSRITEPTEGRVEIKGRVASLLEVGTGFHPELTGRENIYLNGAILGMSRAEIRRKFDEIVTFAGVEAFLDTPVKRYSSGMYVRLAFAVAAHLEPEILIVDEVLAVGDQDFQRKCLGKVAAISQSGRTVLLVSHSMATVALLCKSTILLESGQVAFFGSTDSAIERYLSNLRTQSSAADLRSTKDLRQGTGELRVVCAQLKDWRGHSSDHFRLGDDLVVSVALEGQSGYQNFMCVVLVKTITGINVLHITTPKSLQWPAVGAGGTVRFQCTIPRCGLYPGRYVISLWIGRSAHQEVDRVPDILTFDMEQSATVECDFDMSWSHGLYLCESEWSINLDDRVIMPTTKNAVIAN